MTKEREGSKDRLSSQLIKILIVFCLFDSVLVILTQIIVKPSEESLGTLADASIIIYSWLIAHFLVSLFGPLIFSLNSSKGLVFLGSITFLQIQILITIFFITSLIQKTLYFRDLTFLPGIIIAYIISILLVYSVRIVRT